MDTAPVNASSATAGLARTLLARQSRGQEAPILVLAEGATTPIFEADSASAVVAANPNGWSGTAPEDLTFLAGLLRDGLLSTVVTFDPNLDVDKAIARLLTPGDYLRLVRGEHREDYIERALDFDAPSAKLVKLRGDVAGRSVPATVISQSLAAALSRQACRSDVIWVGNDAEELLPRLFPKFEVGTVWIVGDSRLTASRLMVIECSDVDAESECFFRRLSLRVARQEANDKREINRRRIVEQVRSSQAVDATYSDRMVRRLAQEILDSTDFWSEDVLIVYIHDPDAPGGSEVEKRIVRYLEGDGPRRPRSVRLTVKGQRLRWSDRQASSDDLSGIADGRFRSVYIVDSITFTGRTMMLATNAIRRVIPTAEIFWAVLVASQQLLDRRDLPVASDHVLRAFTTDKHDIFFPWGWTQATSDLVRTVPVRDRTHSVMITQRPWGTVEILADQISCSVRLLTIRAGERLSLQRHLLRDEFFIALDDYIGFEFESADGKVVEAALLHRGDYVSVPRGAVHRFAAHRDSVRLIEIGLGIYDQKYDIERLADDYDRMGLLGDV